ncbi:MAG: hypothetical protein GY948_06430 [Alphaproteobacteria bacterium]|nr:hypothetical protein [Alphaproteobacteria bacterium]
MCFWDAIRSADEDLKVEFGLLFFSKQSFSAEAIATRMALECPDIPYAACSTAGEITPQGVDDGHLVGVLFPADSFKINPVQIANVTTVGFEKVVEQVSSEKRRFLQETGDQDTGRSYAVCLMDGMSFSEETVTAALHWGLDDIPLLGGSAGDDMNFVDTQLILNGEILQNSAILMLCQSQIPFRIFKTDNFVPTGNKLVVTRSDPDRRIVYEFNAAPAVEEYAANIGEDAASLTPRSFASHPLVVRVGGEYYCRSIQKMNDDGSLSFLCAIDDGIVLTIAEPEGMAQRTETAFDDLRSELGAIDMVLGFDCVLRKVDASSRQVLRRVSEIYQTNNVVGFNTYGEQYISMHLNQTFTGIAFESPDKSGVRP